MIYKENYEILIATSSPARIEFLNTLKLNFKEVSVSVDEDSFLKINGEKLTEKISSLKLVSALEKFGKDKCIIAFDTLVKNNCEYIGKITDEKTVFSKILSYSNNLVEVESSFCIFIPSNNKIIKASEVSFIKFAPLSPDLVYQYIELQCWKDKSGGISLKNGAAEILIEYMNGSYSNIVGLPIKLFYDILIEEKIISAI